ncbi:MAG: hypothetical protein VB124_05950 [Burkholderia sp.]
MRSGGAKRQGPAFRTIEIQLIRPFADHLVPIARTVEQGHHLARGDPKRDLAGAVISDQFLGCPRRQRGIGRQPITCRGIGRQGGKCVAEQGRAAVVTGYQHQQHVAQQVATHVGGNRIQQDRVAGELLLEPDPSSLELVEHQDQAIFIEHPGRQPDTEVACAVKETHQLASLKRARVHQNRAHRISR